MNLKQLKSVLSKKEIPQSIQFSQCEKINDVRFFIKSHVKFLENNSGNAAFLPYFQRLIKLNKLLS